MKAIRFMMLIVAVQGCFHSPAPVTPTYPICRKMAVAPGEESAFLERRLTLANSGGWLIVSLVSIPKDEANGRKMNWQVALTHIDARVTPGIVTDESKGLINVSYGACSINDSPDTLRIVRQVKSAKTRDWAVLGSVPDTTPHTSHGTISLYQQGDKYGVYSQPDSTNGRHDVFASFDAAGVHLPLSENAAFRADGTLCVGEYRCQDSGQDFILHRSRP